MKVLITGANGQLGQSFQASQLLAQQFGIELLFADRHSLDITSAQAITKYFQQHEVDCVVNTAAYTAVDRAEEEQEQAALINENSGLANLARYCAPATARIYSMYPPTTYSTVRVMLLTKKKTP